MTVRGNLCPKIEELNTKLSACQIFEIFKDYPYSFFLDSSANTANLGQYSVIGFSPFIRLCTQGKTTELITDNCKKTVLGNPFLLIKQILNEYPITFNSTNMIFPCGAVGYFGYDLGHFVEDLPQNTTNDLPLPDCWLGFYDQTIVVDHKNKKTYLITCNFDKQSTARTKEIKSILNSPPTSICSFPKNPVNPVKNKLTSNFTQIEYIRAVNKVKDYIAAGDIFQVNLSQRFSSESNLPSWELYTKLRKISPAPFSNYFNLDNFSVVSASPELFLKKCGLYVETRPMKGTRPRGKTVTEDKMLAQELLASKKDQAELVMIVDLLRNDLGRVCEHGSVKVKSLRNMEKHPTVFQTTATVTGKLAPDKDAIDLLMACFPGGSITGAPKIRAMEIIDELEPTRRGIYTGSLGYIGFNGDMDLSIVIRTMIVKNEKVWFQVGGGIVADSNPQKEYEETLHKAKALMQVLES